MTQPADTEYLARLRRRHSAGEKLDFLFFWGHRPGRGVGASCFSQWFEAPFELDGERYPTAEHRMMEAKARLFGDEDTARAVLRAANPGAAKALGRTVRGFDEATWERERFGIVVAANRAKFAQNAALAEFLRKTGRKVLVEASPVDRVWGIGLAAADPAAADPERWQGLNLLGFALMAVRDAAD